MGDYTRMTVEVPKRYAEQVERDYNPCTEVNDDRGPGIWSAWYDEASYNLHEAVSDIPHILHIEPAFGYDESTCVQYRGKHIEVATSDGYPMVRLRSLYPQSPLYGKRTARCPAVSFHSLRKSPNSRRV